MAWPRPLPDGLSTAAIALGANLGDPAATLARLRQPLADLLQRRFPAPLTLRWSPLFRTAPVGGPANQPDYLNAVLLIEAAASPFDPALQLDQAEALLADLLALEQRFGRVRGERWGPRCLDLDLLWWGDLRSASATLQLPHPRLRERTFVLAPLATIDPALVPPAGDRALPGDAPTVAALLAALVPQRPEPAPVRLPPQPGWPE